MNRTFCTEIIFLKGFMKMENLIFCLNATIPIFLTLMLGLFFRKIGLFDDTFVSRLNKFVFNAALPALLFLDIAKSDFYSVWNTKFVLFCFFVTLISIGISTGLSYLLKPRNIQGNLSRLLTGAALRSLELQLSRIFTETQEWHRL